MITINFSIASLYLIHNEWIVLLVGLVFVCNKIVINFCHFLTFTAYSCLLYMTAVICCPVALYPALKGWADMKNFELKNTKIIWFLKKIIQINSQSIYQNPQRRSLPPGRDDGANPIRVPRNPIKCTHLRRKRLEIYRKCLIKVGVDIDTQLDEGETPLISKGRQLERRYTLWRRVGTPREQRICI